MLVFLEIAEPIRPLRRPRIYATVAHTKRVGTKLLARFIRDCIAAIL